MSKTALIVFAHQEPTSSFNAALRDTAEIALKKQGYDVEISDLYAQGFDPRSTRQDFTGSSMDPHHLRYKEEAAHAYLTQGMCAQTQAEVDKVKRANLLVFQTPMYWFSVPAILKGWFDKILVSGFAFELPNHMYDTGLMKGKKAVLSMTTGSPAGMLSDRGLNGDINVHLWPIQYGTLRFCGFDVLAPQVTYSPELADDRQRNEMLNTWARRLETIDTEKPLAFVSLEHFDPSKWFVLKDEYIKAGIPLSIGHHLGNR